MTHTHWHLATRCIHVEGHADALGSPHTPLYDTTTFRFPDTQALCEVAEGRRRGYFYSRYGSNPTIHSLEARLASLEEADGALAFASGMAAISATLLAHARNGIVCIGEIYGGTRALLQNQLASLGLPVTEVAAGNTTALDNALQAGARLVYLETPANPTLEIIDIAAVAETAHQHGARVVVDSTFATPVNQQPLVLGADLVIHSATKYLGGHSDLTGGVVAGAAVLLEPIDAWRRNLGQTIAPETAHLLSRSLATLDVRVARHNASALTIAQAMKAHPRVRQVLYPGLPEFPGHAVAARQMRGFGGMLTLAVDGDATATSAVADRFGLFALAVSLGGVESLVSQPALTSHRSLDPATRAARGIGDNLLRLSIGLESPDDLLTDLNQALAIL
ncbi:aminotransferase class I/II-fold pyridoxal phosphate-dependent enzyme [Nitrogeniibacter mangrovi]|uniref:Aminotransferase class I/II-fold pyridoxal phosphate-dependent enzyme n=1 Tax=Nitrogeniibacter mangrovi TaxID=2016596 RepID=A0A6C1B174_9RHOO|nr:aminotransferase class I/II-fold pyridoxal phosphate-dependent enzyme [Nitrogeniibacter mangrovi]QID17376.1 aminotransferase class I/II-fold pyridoxal phosphate-dependent enzyme [Nitrogeniibacter mangrovi]